MTTTTHKPSTTPPPTIGRFVHYELAEGDVALITQQAREHRAAGHSVSFNTPAVGEVYPALVVRVWPSGVLNLQVFLDGHVTYWATSRVERDGQQTAGRWFWPPRV